MNRLDNEFIDIHDEVFDIINGPGRVLESTSVSLTIRFNNNRKMTFDQNGFYNGTRRIFWHNPIIVAPEKDPAAWAAMRTAIAGLTQYVDSIKPPQE